VCPNRNSTRKEAGSQYGKRLYIKTRIRELVIVLYRITTVYEDGNSFDIENVFSLM